MNYCWRTPFSSSPQREKHALFVLIVRNPYGMAFSEEGELYVSDNDMEEKSERAVAEDPDRIWHIRNAKRPHGSVETPEWYGFPDICADGLPVWDEKHRPLKGQAAEPLLENPP